MRAAALMKEERRDRVDHDARGRNPHHRPSVCLGWDAQAPDRLPGHRAHGADQEQGIGQCSEDRRASKAVGMHPRGRPPRERCRGPRHQQAQHIAEVVRRIRKQCGRVREHAKDRLDADERDVQCDADHERAVVRGRLGVTVIVRVTVRVIVVHQVVLTTNWASRHCHRDDCPLLLSADHGRIATMGARDKAREGQPNAELLAGRERIA